VKKVHLREKGSPTYAAMLEEGVQAHAIFVEGKVAPVSENLVKKKTEKMESVRLEGEALLVQKREKHLLRSFSFSGGEKGTPIRMMTY